MLVFTLILHQGAPILVLGPGVNKYGPTSHLALKKVENSILKKVELKISCKKVELKNFMQKSRVEKFHLEKKLG